MFEGITVLYKGSEMVKVLNMKPIHYKLCSVMSMNGCIASVTGRYVQVKEESNAKRTKSVNPFLLFFLAKSC